MKLPRFIRNFFKRKRRPVDYAALHRFIGSFDFCVKCGLRFTDPTHLHPTRMLTLESVARQYDGALPLEGSLSNLAMAIFNVALDAKVYEDARHRFVVFIELPPHDLEALRRAIWWVKPMGVLTVVIGCGALTYTAKDAGLWLTEGRT
jgi:hypothetical protein